MGARVTRPKVSCKGNEVTGRKRQYRGNGRWQSPGLPKAAAKTGCRRLAGASSHGSDRRFGRAPKRRPKKGSAAQSSGSTGPPYPDRLDLVGPSVSIRLSPRPLRVNTADATASRTASPRSVADREGWDAATSAAAAVPPLAGR